MTGMKRVALSLAIGVAAALLLTGAYVGTLYAGVRLPPTFLAVIAAALAFGSFVALFAQNAIGREPAKPKGLELLGKKIRDLDPGFVTSFPLEGSGIVRLLIKPDTRVETLDVVKHPG